MPVEDDGAPEEDDGAPEEVPARKLLGVEPKEGWELNDNGGV